jgi:hypothetical protein
MSVSRFTPGPYVPGALGHAQAGAIGARAAAFEGAVFGGGKCEVGKIGVLSEALR